MVNTTGTRNANIKFPPHVNRKREGSESAKDQWEQSKRNTDDATVSFFLLPLRRQEINRQF